MQALLENLKALGQGRLIALGVTGVVLVLALFFGVQTVTAPNYSTLYRDLTPSEASRMVSALEGAGFRVNGAWARAKIANVDCHAAWLP